MMRKLPMVKDSQSTPGPVRHLLIVEDSPGLQRQMQWALADEFEVSVAADRAAALEIMANVAPKLVVLDLGLPPDPDGATEGLALLTTIATTYPGTKVIVASGNEERTNALKAVSLGAYDFFGKPVDIDQLRLILDRAWRLYLLEEENRRLVREVQHPLDGVIAGSKAMLAVCGTVERIAKTDVNLLILGESGTGKELIAQSLHSLSNRSRKPFVAINCAAIPETLLESELFGYERGAFTGAVGQKQGKVEQAKDGTLFLDEIGDMPMALQAKLLRFLQNRSFERLGGRTTISIDVRLVAATNRKLTELIERGNFREDLYFRLNEVSVALPPLREREGDAVMIASALLRRFATLYNRVHIELSPAAVSAITNYSWPGNIRELENRLKRAVILAQDNFISPADMEIPEAMVQRPLISLRDARRRVEMETIERALAVSGNNMTQAAKVLGISRPTLYSLMSSYGIKTEAS